MVNTTANKRKHLHEVPFVEQSSGRLAPISQGCEDEFAALHRRGTYRRRSTTKTKMIKVRDADGRFISSADRTDT